MLHVTSNKDIESGEHSSEPSDTSEDSGSDDAESAPTVPSEAPMNANCKKSTCRFSKRTLFVGGVVGLLIVVATGVGVVLAGGNSSSGNASADSQETERSGPDQMGPTDAPVPTPAGPFESIYLNAGSLQQQYTDQDNRVFESDLERPGLNGTHTHWCPAAERIQNTKDGELYCSERWNYDSLDYAFPVPNDTYQVVLHFAEVFYKGPGERVFDIRLEQDLVTRHYDIVEEAGGDFRATQLLVFAAVQDGILNLSLQSQVGNPKVNAIEVHAKGNFREAKDYKVDEEDETKTTESADQEPTESPTTSPTASPTTSPSSSRTSPFEPLLINAGANYTLARSNGVTWEKDSEYSDYLVGPSRGVPSVCDDQEGSGLDLVYCSERFFSGNGGYNIPVPNGTYQVELYFAETHFDEADRRVFHITVEENRVRRDFDIFVAAGGSNFQPVVIATEVTVEDGALTIDLEWKKQNPKINAFKITAV